MAITLSGTGYCEASDVAALIQQFEIDANSDPSTTEVEAWITEDFHVLNAILRRAGYAAPVAQGGGSLAATSGNITVASAASISSTAVTLTGTGLAGNVRVGDYLTIAGQDQVYMICAPNHAVSGELSVSIAPALEEDATAGAVVTFSANSGAAQILKKLNALDTAARVVVAAYSATGDDGADPAAGFKAEADALRAMVQGGELDLPSVEQPTPGRQSTTQLIRC